MFNDRYPARRDDESEEEYQERCDAYEEAEAAYIDAYIEQCREESRISGN